MLFGEPIVVTSARTYSKFFSELIDTLIVFAVTTLNGGGHTENGLFVTSSDLKANKFIFRLNSLTYPLVWVFSQLDGLVPPSGYMLIAKSAQNLAPVTLTNCLENARRLGAA